MIDDLDDAILSVIGGYCNCWTPLSVIKYDLGAETRTQRKRIDNHVRSMMRYGILEKNIIIINNHPITRYRVR